MSSPLPGGFGSNLIMFDAANTLGFVYAYDQNQALIRNILAAMRDAGQICVRLNLLYWAADNPAPQEELYSPNGWLLGLYGSNLDSQRLANLTNLLEDIKALGFTDVTLGFGPMGVTLGPQNGIANWPDLDDRWKRTAEFISNMRALIRSVGFRAPGEEPGTPTYGLDFGELPSDSTSVLFQYFQTLWTWYTTAYFDGIPCTDAWMGLREDPAAVAILPALFKGLDQNGKDNWPPKFGLHCYGNAPWPTVYHSILGMIAAIDAIGAPESIPVDIDETYVFSDLTNVTQVVRAARASKRLIRKVLQWPTSRTDTTNNSGLGNPPGGGIPAYLLGAVEGNAISGDPKV